MSTEGWTIRRTPSGGWSGAVDELATSFELRAAEYARLRPGYPDAALDVAVPRGARRVLDLGAGTGKLTGPLLGRGHDVIAVEPLPSMLAELTRAPPAALAVAGTAEADPLVRDVEAALDRVGRPAGGSTGRGRPAEQHAHDSSRPDGSAHGVTATIPEEPLFSRHRSFRDPEVTVIRWRRGMSVEDFIALQHTYSYVIRASQVLQAQLDSEVQAIIRAYIGDAPTVSVPVICQAWSTSCR